MERYESDKMLSCHGRKSNLKENTRITSGQGNEKTDSGAGVLDKNQTTEQERQTERS